MSKTKVFLLPNDIINEMKKRVDKRPTLTEWLREQEECGNKFLTTKQILKRIIKCDLK